MKHTRLKLTLIALGTFFLNGIWAQVTTQTFVYSGTIQSFTVPTGVTQLSVDARGAGGGSVTTCGANGGRGARMTGVITVTPGQVLSVLVGQAGGNSGSTGEGGGGGGSYVTTGTVPLVVAGGGGGASSNIGSCGSNLNGVNASTTTAGTANASGVVAGGSGGNGGTGSGGSGGGGGGFYTNGTSSSNTNGGGRAFVNGGAGGFGTSSSGGFGGGGCGWSTGGNGGGGGGYSGGGTYGSSPYTGGGGGGSYNIGTNQINTAGFQSGNGLVILSYGPGGNSSGPLVSGSSALSFSYTGSVQNFTVPACVNSITFNVQGAKGGSGFPIVSSGGNGGAVAGVMTVTPGQVLQLYVGGLGSAGITSGPAAGGFNGGGAGAFYSGSYAGGGGGGASDIRVSPYALANRLVVAGGGGGGAYNSSTTNYDRGGHGGGTTGQAGLSGSVIGGTAPGGGGSPTSGGTGGFWSGYCTAFAGSLGNGGSGCTSSGNSGGGGGGGYYGGGGGVWAGGGGGSNYTDPSITSVTHTQGVNSSSGTISFTLGVNGNMVNGIVATPSVLCAGSTVTLSTGGLSTYTWSSASGVISSTSSVAVTPSATSSYTVMATNSVGCVSGYSISVVSNSLPIISVNSGTICNGKTFTMVPSGANTYTYAGGSNTVAPTSNNIYTVTGTSAVGCVAATSAVSSVTVVALPVVSAASGTICTGGTYTIVPSGASTYTYSSGSSLVSPTSNTNYSVTGTSSVGCISLPTPLTVSVSPLPTIAVNSGGICSGKVFTITPSGAATYSISSGGSGTSFTVSPAVNTNYLITGTSSVGCVSSSGALSSVTVNASPTIAVSSGTLCSNNTYSIVASGASTYTYSGGSSTVNPVTTTSYSVTGTSSLGCLSSNTAVSTVTVYTTPTLVVNSGQICIGQTFTMSPSGANTYSYSNGSATVSPIVTSNYSVTGTSIQGCAAFNTVVSNVTVNPTPTIGVNSGTLCSGNSFTIVPTGAFSYSISGGSAVVNPIANAVYFVTGTSALGCIGTNTAVSTVTVYTSPVITVNSGSICSGNVFTMLPSGASSYTYSSNSATVNPLVSSSYSVVGSNSLGCISNTAVSSVTVNITPTLSVNSGSICSGQSFVILPSGASTYTISGGSFTVSPLSSSSYTVNGTSAQGCNAVNPAISSVTVNVTPTLSVNSGSICSGQTFSIVPSGANTYTVSGGSTTVSPLNSSSYTVTGTSVDGCLASNSVVSTVTVYALPVMTVVSTRSTICVGESNTLTVSGASSYSWSSSASGASVVISPTVTTAYSVVGTSTNGCSSTNTVSQTVDLCAGIANNGVGLNVGITVFPNPNNGRFEILLPGLTNVTVEVYSLVGQQIIRVTDVSTSASVNLTNYDNGIYFVKVIENNKIIANQKVVKQ
ncbi:MAG: T9SS type A sorting domain-containing protein [Bacteroidia bacterium]|nr:T9SS type A sorting domain-containing protein [Bacteroidia bacterium]